MLCMIKEVQNSKDSSMAFGPFGLPLEYWTYKRLLREVLVDFDATLECVKRMASCHATEHVPYAETTWSWKHEMGLMV